MLLLAGGHRDPNLDALERAAKRQGVAFQALRSSPGHSPALIWDLQNDQLIANGDALQPSALFLRHDVFGQFEPGVDPQYEHARAYAWFSTVQAWSLAHPNVAELNRQIRPTAASKPAALQLARANGLRIAPTWISNALPMMVDLPGDDWISKPVAGGDHCITLEQAVAKCAGHQLAPAPSIVQARLRGREWRVFLIGDQHFTFEMRSPSLDYRVQQDVELTPTEPPPGVLEPLRKLMLEMGMDFGAADLKEADAAARALPPGTPAEHTPYFLELNTSPMFARFDQVAGGVVADAMVTHLMQLAATKR